MASLGPNRSTPRGKLPSREYGTLHIAKPKLEQWQRVVAISQEQGRSEAEAEAMIEQAVRLAVVQAGARQVVRSPIPPTAIERLVSTFDATVEPTAEPGMCSFPEEHGAYHERHPATSRQTCVRCYPPAVESGDAR